MKSVASSIFLLMWPITGNTNRHYTVSSQFDKIANKVSWQMQLSVSHYRGKPEMDTDRIRGQRNRRMMTMMCVCVYTRVCDRSKSINVTEDHSRVSSGFVWLIAMRDIMWETSPTYVHAWGTCLWRLSGGSRGKTSLKRCKERGIKKKEEYLSFCRRACENT